MFLIWWGEDDLQDSDPDPPLWWWLSPIYSGIGPLPKMKAGRVPTTAKFEGRQLVHAIPTKVVFACKSLWW